MSGTQTSTRPRHTREVSTKATGTIKDINEGAEFAQRVLYMFETVVELVNKVLIFPTKFSTQKQELKAEQQRTAATFLKSQDNIRIALNKPGLTKEEIEEILRDVKEEQGKDWPEKSEANQHMFMFNAWIYKPPESFVVKGLLDTGADVSWISIDALRRANLTTGIKRVTNLQEFVGVDGKKVQSLGKITIQWWYTGVEAINQTEFFVIENLGDELDMIVGTEDIIKHELVVLKSATRVLRKYNKPKDIAKAADRANKFDALNEVLNKELEKQELKKFEEKQEELRGGSGAAGPSSPASSTNTTKSHSRPGPPPIPPKSANVIARYNERERTQSSPDVIVHAPEDSSPSPSLGPPISHSRSSSVGSLGGLSLFSNRTTDSTSTPRTSQSSENAIQRFIAQVGRQRNGDPDEEQQAGPTDRRSTLRLPSLRRLSGRKSDKKKSAQLL